MSEPVKDKYGIRIFPAVARLDPYGEATLKRFSVAKIPLKRSELEDLSGRYYLQGLVFLSKIRELAHIEPTDYKLVSRLLRKAAIAFDEAADVESFLHRSAE